jgi:hypothetical protein
MARSSGRNVPPPDFCPKTKARDEQYDDPSAVACGVPSLIFVHVLDDNGLRTWTFDECGAVNGSWGVGLELGLAVDLEISGLVGGGVRDAHDDAAHA